MGFVMKIGRNFKNGFAAIVDFIRGSVRELKKVRWPNRKELFSYSKIVIFVVVFITIFFYVADLLISLVLNLIGFGN